MLWGLNDTNLTYKKWSLNVTNEESDFDSILLQIFTNLAYIMFCY